ncbi:LysE/ArgO family amino acid transporter [Neisseria weaveri]|uniref:LysE/ArgO family amino acid transporter n=1 Tax=Neisseria weaveri TaxID=28091 RepID=UPI0002232076|nr:LysE/ArgO family amino acid transporter [Neisseria weaveri]EGV38570.1 hypothetical protein l13_01030 [Neisseria weaveri ATCC 51223]
MTAFFNGLMITGGLIIAIGAQNAFVLKQGLLKQNIGIVVLLCWLCDFVLIACGTFGVSALFSQNSTASLILSASGGIFLLLYGLAGLKRAFRANNALIVAAGNKIDPPTAWKTATATLAITLLNPHVYIDTIMLIGGSAAALSFQEKWYFLSGALMTSAIWFCSIGFGARLLLPLFRRETTWQILDLIIAVMMFYLSYTLLLPVWEIL